MNKLKTKLITPLLGIILILLIACSKDEFKSSIEIPDFNFPKTHVFADTLSYYGIFEGSPSELIPSEDFELLELSSVLFTDYAHKQRLLRIPNGKQIMRSDDGSIDFPNGTILTKTFFYYIDERNPSFGKKIIETRIEIKEGDVWNAATYVWDQDQEEAILKLDGLETEIDWIDENGRRRSIGYQIPSENQCMTCHQSNERMAPLGPTLLNLNRSVERDGITVNQLKYFQEGGLLNNFSVELMNQMVNYKDWNSPMEERARAYLAMNCAHCHNPDSWQRAAEHEFDFRYETSLEEAGILFEEEKIKRALQEMEMPLIGTTLLDEAGVNLVSEYLDKL